MKSASQPDFPKFEAEMLKIWADEKTFERSLEQRQGGPRFSFYDGPPFANGLPHYGHVSPVSLKDAVTRYKTMRGYFVPRRNGWDTHGLPVEYEVEKQLGLAGKRQILDLGVDKFNEACRASVFKYKAEWEEFFRRIGRWADIEHSYATLDDDYIESVWWVLAELHQKHLVYRGFRSNAYCPRCATPLSNFEVNQNYKDDVPDPSVYVKFALVDQPGTALLAWTTTPWTLPANAALAVDPKAKYVAVELTDDGDGWRRGERLILARARLGELELRKAEYKLVDEWAGAELVGLRYEPLYKLETRDLNSDKRQATSDKLVESKLETSNLKLETDKAWRVYADASVSLEDGTGILHVAPRYGETDLALGLRENLPLIESVDGFGQMVGAFKEVSGLEQIAGQFFKDADAHIVADLGQKGRLFAAETFTHTYPFCWRCETPLLYFAMPSWFVRVTELRDRLVTNNQPINWVPEHIKQGRFGNWLAEARDWNFSRNRFWGAPLPIWVNEKDENDVIVVGSLDELRELSGHQGDLDLHRPGIDQVVIKRNGQTYRRVEEVFDCWFESGAMPYAQDHYSFEGKAEFASKFPAEFIAESMDQTRGWFYTLHVLATALFDQPAFRHVICGGIVVAADGKKLSKRLRNYPPMDKVFDQYGADILRFFMLSSPVVAGEDVRFSEESLRDLQRNLFLTLWNSYSFLALYAEMAGWEPGKEGRRLNAEGRSLNHDIQHSPFNIPHSTNLMDRWLLARLDETIAEMTKQADAYKIAPAVRPLRDLIDDLSNWYVRRNRRRFSRNEDVADREAAFTTLHYVLVRISQLLAPWSPFLADKLWRELTVGMKVPTSVHLSDWPAVRGSEKLSGSRREAGEADDELLTTMRTARELVTEGLSQRAEAKIKVRQPLAGVVITTTTDLSDELLDMVRDELNVKKVIQKRGDVSSVILNTEITQQLRAEGVVRDFIRHVQELRKRRGLSVEDEIRLCYQADGSIAEALDQFGDLIRNEARAAELSDRVGSESATVQIDGRDVKIALEKRP